MQKYQKSSTFIPETLITLKRENHGRIKNQITHSCTSLSKLYQFGEPRTKCVIRFLINPPIYLFLVDKQFRNGCNTIFGIFLNTSLISSLWIGRMSVLTCRAIQGDYGLYHTPAWRVIMLCDLPVNNSHTPAMYRINDHRSYTTPMKAMYFLTFMADIHEPYTQKYIFSWLFWRGIMVTHNIISVLLRKIK